MLITYQAIEDRTSTGKAIYPGGASFGISHGDAYLTDDETCLLHIIADGYWYQHVSLMLDLRATESRWTVRSVGLYMSTDFISEWLFPIHGHVTIDDSRSPESTIGCQFHLEARGADKSLWILSGRTWLSPQRPEDSLPGEVEWYLEYRAWSQR